MGDGVLSAKDFADTRDANGNGIVDPEDIIVRFSNGKDEDKNGYPDDISGWDFYNDQNDPATVDGAFEHANNQMRQAAAQTDNGFMGAGVCPRCRILPVKAGAEALDRTDDLAEAWLYAADAGADVIASVTADLGYSSFMRQTVESLWKRGVVMVAASNDFDSIDHQGGMFHPHVVPANGLTTNTRGIPGPAGNPLTTTFRARSGQTSWGTKNFLSVSTQGGSTSTSVPTHAGVYALILAAGKDAADARRIDGPLTNAEALQVARATASDISGPQTNWPSRPGFDLQFGYGRPHVLRAMTAVDAGDIPPVGWIESPDWYELFDPTRTTRVEVRGHVEARRSTGYSWKLEVAPGAEPDDAAFFVAGTGGGSRPFDGKLGTVDLKRIPESFWSKAYTLSRTKTLETAENYTVTLRLRVTDAKGRVGEERRAIAVTRDPTWRKGFPKKVTAPGAGGEGQAALADLQGKGRLAMVFGDSDGNVRAIDSGTGRPLKGWPARTDRTKVQRAHAGIDPGREPIIANVATGDLDGDGSQSVVAASSTGKVYVWGANGKRRSGWPRRLDTGVLAPRIPRERKDFTREPKQGAFAPPVLVDLNSDGRLDVVQSGWDGRIHAWSADGKNLPGWPVEVTVPPSMAPGPGYLRLNDHKLNSPPAVADLDGDGKPELVQRSQYFDIIGEGIQPAGRGYLHAYRADGRPVAGFPIRMQALVVYYGSAQEFVTEGSSVPAIADVDGDGDDEIAVGPIFTQPSLYDGDGSLIRPYGPSPGGAAKVLTDPAGVLASGGLPDDVQVNFTTSGAFGRFGPSGALTMAQPSSGAASVAGALLLTGSGLPIKSAMRAFDAKTGLTMSGYPADSQGIAFLGGPAISDVTGDGRPELLEAGDSNATHAFAAGGAQAAGFPKWQTGWTLYAPSTGDLDGDGKVEVVQLTREGYLFVWNTPGVVRGDDEWWSFRHDERNTSRYGTDTRPPAAARSAKLSKGTLSFTAPGDEWLAGTAKSYVVTVGGKEALRATPSGPAGTAERLELPPGVRRATLRAVDEAGNIGPPVAVGPRSGSTGRACVSRRRFQVTVPARVGGRRVTSARVTVAGRAVRVRRAGGRRVATVDLRGRKAGRFQVRITVRVASRVKPVTLVRTYRTCVF